MQPPGDGFSGVSKGFPGGSDGKESAAMQETKVPS